MLTVNDLMTTTPITVTPATPLPKAATLMQMENCQHLPVIDHGQLVGILTDRDIRLARNLALYDEATCESCMTQNPITTSPDMPADQAAELLTLYKIGSLPVLDGSELVGIVTVNDFLRRFNGYDKNGYTDDFIIDGEYDGWNLING